jgi:hypothetical protein
LISSPIDAPVHIDVPKSKRTTPHIHVANCFQMGWSRPKRARSLLRSSSDTAPLSPAKRNSTMSPGTMRMRTKMSTATPRSVGNISRKRLAKYFHMAEPTPPSPCPLPRGERGIRSSYSASQTVSS